MARKPGLMLAIKSADFLPKRLLGQPQGVAELHLGTLIGEAIGTKLQPDPNDATKTQESIVGAFRFIDAQDPERVLEAPKLWVPEMISEPVKNALRDPETGEVRATSLDIAFEIYAIRSSAPVGYTWKAEPVFEPEESPTSSPFARIMERKRLALPAPAQTTEAEPKKVAPKAKGK